MQRNNHGVRSIRKTVLILLAVMLLSGSFDPVQRLHAAPLDKLPASLHIQLQNEPGSLPLSIPGVSEPSFQSRETGQQKKKKISRRDATSWVDLQQRYPGTFVIGGPRKERKVALTFDDVPDPRYTSKVLDILARHKVRATFFVVGSRAASYPSIVRRIGREGHVIGNHSYNHAVFSRISLFAFQQQIRNTDAILRPLAGYSPRLIRPPYGEVLPGQIEWMKQNGYIAVNWDVDSVDWRGIDSSTILFNIKKTLQPGSIILQHAGGGIGQDLSGTLEALPKLIKLLRSKGYQMVTLPELLGEPAARSVKP
ncbi:polysaccharide deacetylase family protein [Paenibacillus sepulcri]|uniref:Polysaccharide deacetylase family protein n=1 Tax=Paenibacillus sepulcri TaxID=359917 RepID=A0ABS7C458_9BACL|nr:polysaccharide deacetylase family protein [Paenibacillus sepulcri]